ncbi:D-alanyl-D-alanine carboxypeptidase family protein [Lichenibacterium ramalinae]|uniref:D-alanyl-D-alanine carboxypeptidase family protein n=1 Tax=Lichenibacterium ramalinae TaxID=2316527 RepID=UPI001FE225C3|nr:D-alanyl-D-alanine carboxypeptidase family protein [Lichenibacterium ramalinae]
MVVRGVKKYRVGRLVPAATMALALLAGGAPAEARGRHAFHRFAHNPHVAHAARAALGGTAPNFSAIVIDANSGRELYGVNEDAPRHPASITKVMTLFLLFEQMEKGRIGLDTPLQVSAHAAGQSPTKLGVPAGGSVTVETAIKAIVTRSANDMAVTVAENLAGDELTFAKLMTAKAHALGMHHTFYHNASGLPDMRQITTARDLTILGRAIHDRFPHYYRYFSTPSFVYRGEVITSHNHLMARMQGMDGIKTGYTNASGFNLLSSIQRGGRHVVAVVMGGKSAASRDNVMQGLLESHFEEAQAGPASHVAEGSPVEEAAEPPHREVPSPPPVERATPRRPPVEIADGDDDAAENAPDDEPVPLPVERRIPRGPSLIAPEMAVPVPERAPERVRLARSADDRPRPAFIAGAPRLPDQARAAGKLAPDGSTNRRTVAAASTGAAVATATPSSLRWVTGPQPVRLGPSGPDVKVAQASRAAPISFGPASEDRTDTTPGPRETAGPSPTDARGPAGARGGVVIQIGATDNPGAAAELLSRARNESRSALASARPFTEKVQKGDATLYRARFAGLEPAEAELACKTLKRSGFACFATRD